MESQQNNQLQQENPDIDNLTKLRIELLQMGFDQTKISDALLTTSNKQAAINLILNNHNNPTQTIQKQEDFQDDDEDYKMIFVVRMDLKLQLSKIAECVATAALKAYKQMQQYIDIDQLKEHAFYQWSECGQKKIVVKSPSQEQLLELIEKAKKAKVNFSLVYQTLLNLNGQKMEGNKKNVKKEMIGQSKEEQGEKQKERSNQKEVLILGAFGPASESQLDPLTKHFKLL